MLNGSKNDVLGLFRKNGPKANENSLKSKNLSEIEALFDQDPERARLFIHVGKCGGGSATKAIQQSDMADLIKIVHARKPPFDPRFTYLLILRNPLSRAVSAFNWRKKLFTEKPRLSKKRPQEAQVYIKYKNLNELAENLYDTTGTPQAEAQNDFMQIAHLNGGIPFYLDHIVREAAPHQIDFVFLQEFLDEDLRTYFDLPTPTDTNPETARLHVNGTNMWREHLSPLGSANLRRRLVKDYQIISTLYAWGKISPERMAVLLD